MRLNRGIGDKVALLVLGAASLSACSALYAGGTTAPSPAAPAPTPAVHVEASTTGPAPQLADTSSASATTACSALLDNIPDAEVNSGKATVAAAYDVNGSELAIYLERMHDEAGVGGYPSTWRDKPTQRLTMCIFDGDFTTLTPGPEGHDTSASRVLILIDDTHAFLWAIALEDASAIPITDPNTLSQ
jgi:hypothetical protein